MAQRLDERTSRLVRKLGNCEWYATPLFLTGFSLLGIFFAVVAGGLVPTSFLTAPTTRAVETVIAMLVVPVFAVVVVGISVPVSKVLRRRFFRARAGRIAAEIRAIGPIRPTLLRELRWQGFGPVIDRYGLAQRPK